MLNCVAQWDYLHFDQFTGKTITARSSRKSDCLVCGDSACLARGDTQEQDLALPTLTSFVPTDTIQQRLGRRAHRAVARLAVPGGLRPG